jgi:YD repeat-containing protein
MCLNVKRHFTVIWSALMAIVLSVAFSPIAFATVDMKNANYTESWIDVQIAGSGYSLRVQRTYNSRSVFNGMFGFGWCSDFETSLTKNPEGFLKLQECGAGQEVTFKPQGAGGDSVTKTIDTIIAYYKKTNPNSGESSVATLRDQLLNNSSLRTNWAKQAGLKEPTVAKGSIFVSDNLEVEKIEFDGLQYTRNLADGSSQRFNVQGKLIAIYDKNGNFLKFNYSGDLMKEATDNTGKKLTFTFYPTKRVKDITAPGGVKVEYKYKGEDLSQVKNMWKNVYDYEYDENHNITKITFPDKTFKALSYNQKNDWVMSFTDRAVDGPACKETYEYFSDKANPKDHFWSTAVKKCGNEIKNEARFEFWLKSRADGRKYLSRVLNRSMTDTLDVTYHPEFGRPTSIKRNSQTTSFDYFTSGLVKEKSTATTRLQFEYKNTFNKVSKVTTEFFDAKGKVGKKRDTTFNYDNRGNLAAAQNTDGQTVRLTYDQRGRIATIIDQAKKEVQIKYEERTGRPAQITRPKVGSIAVTYKANGEINKVESNDGPAVATQVASTFNNLLDIIAPATSEMNL